MSMIMMSFVFGCHLNSLNIKRRIIMIGMCSILRGVAKCLPLFSYQSSDVTTQSYFLAHRQMVTRARLVMF